MDGEPKGTGTRAKRVADRIREELMEMLLRGEIHDPGTEGALVSSVHVTDDLGLARVHVRSDQGEVTPARQRALIRGLERAKGFIRRTLGARLRLKQTPDLQFFWDEGLDHALRIEALLEEVKNEAAEKEPTEGPGPSGGSSDPDDEEA